MNWMISANAKLYDHASSFAHYGYIDWRQGNPKYELGDIVYIYCTNPIKRLRYKCQITKLNMDYSQIRDDQEYWLDKSEYEKFLSGKFFQLKLLEEVDSDKLSLELLKMHGLNAAPQGPIKIKTDLETYINIIFKNADDDFFPEVIDSESDIFEGFKKTVNVNKYERSSIARSKCIEANGSNCKICGFSFENTYGELGKGFIHVHHIVPLHTLGKSYKINYANDLIPVCPNCHAMLHKKLSDKYYSVEEMRGIIKNAKQN